MSPSKTEKEESVFRDDLDVLFINLVVLDPSEAVKQKVSEKFESNSENSSSKEGGETVKQRRRGVGFRKRNMLLIEKVATKIATKLVTPERIASQMATLLPQKLPDKMAAKGLTAVAETVFLEGPYLVIQLQIQKVSPEVLVEAQAVDHYDKDTGELEVKAKLETNLAERIIAWMRWFLGWIGIQNQRELEQNLLPRLVQQRMEPMLKDILQGKLERKGIQAAAQVCQQAEQARYFYQLLQQVRRAQQDNLSVMEFKAKLISFNETAFGAAEDSDNNDKDDNDNYNESSPTTTNTTTTPCRRQCVNFNSNNKFRTGLF